MEARAEGLVVGTRVQVRNRFLAEFVGGFEVLEVTPEGYAVRRCSDGAPLPTIFAAGDIRPEPAAVAGVELLLR